VTVPADSRALTHDAAASASVVAVPEGAVADQAVATRAVVLVDVRPERRGPMISVVEMAIGGGTVAQVSTADEAMAAVERFGAEAAIVEVQLPLADGLAVIAALRAAYPALVIVVCTFHHDPVTEQRAEDAGADAYVVKPVSTRELRGVLAAGRRAPLVETSPR
jgi:DNA-binding response OmpR family regulator